MFCEFKYDRVSVCLLCLLCIISSVVKQSSQFVRVVSFAFAVGGHPEDPHTPLVNPPCPNWDHTAHYPPLSPIVVDVNDTSLARGRLILAANGRTKPSLSRCSPQPLTTHSTTYLTNTSTWTRLLVVTVTRTSFPSAVIWTSSSLWDRCPVTVATFHPPDSSSNHHRSLGKKACGACSRTPPHTLRYTGQVRFMTPSSPLTSQISA
jgi:hypothetical protein